MGGRKLDDDANPKLARALHRLRTSHHSAQKTNLDWLSAGQVDVALLNRLCPMEAGNQTITGSMTPTHLASMFRTKLFDASQCREERRAR